MEFSIPRALRMPGRAMLAFFAAAASLGTVAFTQAKPGFEIRGTVVDGVTGAPVEDARVWFFKRASTSTGQQILIERVLTDARGAFLLWAPTAGEYSLSASAGSIAFGEYDRDPFSGSQRWFSVSGRKSGIVIKLWKRPEIKGMVRDENDQPLAGAIVYALRASILGDRQVLSSVGRAMTGADGGYSLHVRSLDRCLVMAVPRLTPKGSARAVQYHAGTTSPIAALPLELAKSQTTVIDFRLKGEQGFVVSGIVELPPRMEGPNSVELFDLAGPELPVSFPVATAQLSNLGTFMFPPVVAGSYEIRFVRTASYAPDATRDGAIRYNDQNMPSERLAPVPDGPTWWTAERINVVDKDVTVSLQLRPGVRVSGRIVFKEPGEKPDASVLPTRGIYLRSVDYRFFRPFQVGSAREDGTFQTVAVPPGRYVLGLIDPFRTYQGYDGYQLESVKIGGREVAGVGFDLIADVRDAVLTFSSHPTILTGSVWGKPGQQRSVLIWPEDELLRSGRGTQLERLYSAKTVDGTYSVPVFPGTYRVVGLDGVPPSDWESSAYLNKLLPDSRRVTVPAGQTVTHNALLAKVR